MSGFYRLNDILAGILDHLEKAGYAIPADLVEFKTYAHYSHALRGNVRELYYGNMQESVFVDSLLVLVDEQLTRAWNEGMRKNELDPEQDMIDEWQQVLDEAKLSELDYVDDFAREIVQTSRDDIANDSNNLPLLLARADTWANRYTDIVNLAVITTAGGKNRLVWTFGDTEHCDTCQKLNGIVAFASEWQLAGVQPQSPPNAQLDCGGWHCACTLEPTDQRRTRNAWDRIMDALA